MAAAAPPKSFDEMIQADRLKRKNEELADQILGGGRRKVQTSGAGNLSTRRGGLNAPPSLASRVGVTKRSSSVQPKPNIDGPWTHDLYSGKSGPLSTLSRTASAGNLQRNRLYDAAVDGASKPTTGWPAPNKKPISIKGIAHTGPYVVIGSNFAPGTTAADIKAAMVTHGEVIDCYLTATHPTPTVEIVFDDLASAESVISNFHGQKADGKVLHMYMKPDGPSREINRQIGQIEPVKETPVVPMAVIDTKPTILPTTEIQADEGLMEVDEEPQQSHDNGRYSSDRRGYDRERDRYDNDRGTYQDGRYSFNNGYDRRDQRDYRRDRDPRGYYRDDYRRGGRYR